MPKATAIAGLSADEIESRIYDELERLYESGGISSFDRALRLGARLREARGQSIPVANLDPDDETPSGLKASKGEQVVALRALLAAGADLADIERNVTSKRGVVLPGGVSWRLTSGQWGRFIATVARGDASRTRDVDVGSVVRTAELQRLQRIAAGAESDGNWQAAHRAAERVIDYVDDVAPMEPMNPVEHAARLTGTMFNEVDLNRFDDLFTEDDDV